MPVPTEFSRAVQSSRYTVLVLSPAFLADRWLQFGDQLASFARVEGRNRLIRVDPAAGRAAAAPRVPRAARCNRPGWVAGRSPRGCASCSTARSRS
ncbi:MAG: hypothetical protein ACM30E_09290 [Nitrososphaerales archaeon]